MIWLIGRRTEDDMHSVTHNLVDGSLVTESYLHQFVEVAVYEGHGNIGFQRFHQGGKALQIGKNEAHIEASPTHGEQLWTVQ